MAFDGARTEELVNSVTNGLLGKTVLGSQQAGNYPGTGRAQMSVAATWVQTYGRVKWMRKPRPDASSC